MGFQENKRKLKLNKEKQSTSILWKKQKESIQEIIH
jgi:hypothetical protein